MFEHKQVGERKEYKCNDRKQNKRHWEGMQQKKVMKWRHKRD